MVTWLGRLTAAAAELLAVCAASAVADCLLDDGGAARGVRAVCGLCAALRVAALAAGLLG